MLEAADWPEVPANQRPKSLYVNYLVSPEDQAALGAKGWMLIDVRLLPNTTLTERQTCVLAWFEGLRLGTIEMGKGRILDVLEIEAKTCGLTNLKQAPEKPKDLEQETIDSILDIKNRRQTRLKA
jgi:hypothetical protein